jgi:hypothetical protein
MPEHLENQQPELFQITRMNPLMMCSNKFISLVQQTLLPREIFEAINDQTDRHIGLQIRIKVHWV